MEPTVELFDTIGPLTLKLRNSLTSAFTDKNDAAVIVLLNGKVPLSIPLLSSTKTIVVVPFKEGKDGRYGFEASTEKPD